MTYKILGQSNPTAATQTTLYTNPLGSQTVCSTISVCNQGTSTTYSVIIHRSSVAISAKDYIVRDAVLPASTTKFITIGITLADTDNVTVISASGAVSFNMFGEVTASPETTATVIDEPWVRPTYWLPLPAISDSESKFVGLYAVNKDTSNMAVTCAGNYVVDWGDGTVDHVLSGVKAQHQYVYNNISADTLAPVTFSGNRVERTAHGLTNSTIVSFYNLSGSLGVNEGGEYYVIDADTDSFQVSSEIGGTALTLTNGTATLIRDKQVIITITPDTAATITSMDFNVRHSLHSDIYTTGLIDIHVSIPTMTSFNLGGESTYVDHRKLKSCKISEHTITNFSCMFNRCTTLRSLEVDTSVDTSDATNFSFMFYDCRSLTSIPLLNTSSGTNFSNMFTSCNELKTIPLIDTSNGTDFSYMFYTSGIESIPALNLVKGQFISTIVNFCKITSSKVINTKIDIDYSDQNLSPTALNEIYTNLATVSGKTITVTGNWGTASDTPSIATAKGWTVTG